MQNVQRHKRISRELTQWYARYARDLPWRRRSDAYAIWISEIMLQQTRVDQAGPYYLRWLEKFPDVQALAAAEDAEVLKAWEGLGYYARARNLLAAARKVVREYDGNIPSDPEELLKLPGVGRYTAGAIASIAFDLDEPVLDGNVTRVLCRVFAIREDPRSSATQEILWKLARDLIPRGKASVFNQAVMDLGATICTPRKPSCQACPLSPWCQAFAQNLQAELPLRAEKKKIPHYDIAVAVIVKGDKVLIDQRLPEGLLGGLWEFPGGKMEPGETAEAAALREAKEEVAMDVSVEAPLATVRHAYSHFRVTLHAFRCRPVGGRARAVHCQAVKWVALGELDSYAFPKANHPILAALRKKK